MVTPVLLRVTQSYSQVTPCNLKEQMSDSFGTKTSKRSKYKLITARQFNFRQTFPVERSTTFFSFKHFTTFAPGFSMLLKSSLRITVM